MADTKIYTTDKHGCYFGRDSWTCTAYFDFAFGVSPTACRRQEEYKLMYIYRYECVLKHTTQS